MLAAPMAFSGANSSRSKVAGQQHYMRPAFKTPTATRMSPIPKTTTMPTILPRPSITEPSSVKLFEAKPAIDGNCKRPNFAGYRLNARELQAFAEEDNYISNKQAPMRIKQSQLFTVLAVAATLQACAEAGPVGWGGVFVLGCLATNWLAPKTARAIGYTIGHHAGQAIGALLQHRGRASLAMVNAPATTKQALPNGINSHPILLGPEEAEGSWLQEVPVKHEKGPKGSAPLLSSVTSPTTLLASHPIKFDKEEESAVEAAPLLASVSGPTPMSHPIQLDAEHEEACEEEQEAKAAAPLAIIPAVPVAPISLAPSPAALAAMVLPKASPQLLHLPSDAPAAASASEPKGLAALLQPPAPLTQEPSASSCTAAAAAAAHAEAQASQLVSATQKFSLAALCLSLPTEPKARAQPGGFVFTKDFTIKGGSSLVHPGNARRLAKTVKQVETNFLPNSVGPDAGAGLPRLQGPLSMASLLATQWEALRVYAATPADWPAAEGKLLSYGDLQVVAAYGIPAALGPQACHSVSATNGMFNTA